MGGGRRAGRKREPERRPKRPTKDLFVTTLHRRPCRWDLIAYELAGALGGAYAKVRPSLAPGGVRFDSDDVPTVGLMLAQGFEVVLRRAVRDEPNGPAARCLDAGAFGPDEADALASRAAADAFGPLLRKYAEDVYDVILPRPDRDLARLSEALAAALRLVLAGRCGPGGDLVASLADPLAPARADLPDNGLPPDPARPSGLGRGR